MATPPGMPFEIRRQFEKLETRTRSLLAEAARLSARDYEFRPIPTEWSVGDVLDHLVKVETALMSEVAGQMPNGRPLRLRDRMGAKVVVLTMKSPVRIKVPASATRVLPQPASLSETTARWSEARQEMARLLGSLEPGQLSLGFVRHPVSGWMSMPIVLDFLDAHLQHHEYQIERLKAAMTKL